MFFVHNIENRTIAYKNVQLLDGRLQWKSKPEPYGIKFPKKTYIQSWKAMEAQTHKELWNAVAKARFRPVGHEDADEVESATFRFRDDCILIERF